MTPFPSQLNFEKWHGLRNDFILMREEHLDGAVDHAALARKLCDRREGVGADGLLVLGPAERPSMTVYNADGSRPEMCGNGLRCAAAWYAQTTGEHDRVVVRTDAGARSCAVQARGDDHFDVEVDMGGLRFGWSGGPEEVVDEVLGSGWVVDAGNPHWIFFREGPGRAILEEHGSRLEVDARFPDRTNVEVVARLPGASPAYRVDVWERGCGLTEACGTGACAVVGALVRHGRVTPESSVMVELPGGVLDVRVDERFGVRMRGPATRVFCATLAPCDLPGCGL